MDSYRGHTVRLRYMLKVTVSKSVGGFSQEFPLWVQNPCKMLPTEEPIKVRLPVPCDTAWHLVCSLCHRTTYRYLLRTEQQEPFLRHAWVPTDALFSG